MLQHEPTPEALHHPFTSNYASPLTSQEMESMTPQELAQAIVAVEERQGTSLQEGAASPVLQQVIEKSNLAITPDSLLAEVHRQRAQSHQNSAMTPHLTQNLTVRLLIAWGMLSSLAILLLLAGSFVLANRFSDANEALAKYNRQAELKASAPNALQRLQAWKYPGATSLGSSQGTASASATMTTNDAYTKVWHFYAQQAGFNNTMSPQRPNSPQIDGTQNLWASGGTAVNGQPAQYDIQSSPTKDEQVAVFTQSSPLHNITTTLTHHVGDPSTTVRIMVTIPQ